MGKKYIYLSLAVILFSIFFNYILSNQSLAVGESAPGQCFCKRLNLTVGSYKDACEKMDIDCTWTATTTTVGAQTPTPITLSNPISTLDPRVLIGKIVKGILALLGSIALLIFVWSGFTLIISRGNADKVKSSINSITWAILGIGLCLISYIIINQIIKTLTG